jgi:F-type H+-transporting ATPase subunit a
VSYFSKIFSLAIRLFANMMSGHILLKILIGFVWVIAGSNLIH